MIKVQKAETELDRAREAVTSWEKALEAAKTAQTKAETAAPPEVDQIDAYGTALAEASAKTRAAQNGLKQAKAHVIDALKGVVEAHLVEDKKTLVEVRKKKNTHEKAVQKLLKQLTDLDAAEYRPYYPDISPGSSITSRVVSSLDVMKRDISYREKRIDQLEKYLDGKKEKGSFDFVDQPQYLKEWMYAVYEAEQS